MVIKATGNNQSRTVHRVFQRSNSSSSTLFLAAHLHENTNHESPCYSNLEVLLEIGICSDWSGISYACPCGSPSCRTLTLLISNPSPPSSCIIKDFVETTIKKVIRSPLNQYSFRWLATKDLNHFGIDFGSARLYRANRRLHLRRNLVGMQVARICRRLYHDLRRIDASPDLDGPGI